jgi:hypothetical protein
LHCNDILKKTRREIRFIPESGGIYTLFGSKSIFIRELHFNTLIFNKYEVYEIMKQDIKNSYIKGIIYKFDKLQPKTPLDIS